MDLHHGPIIRDTEQPLSIILGMIAKLERAQLLRLQRVTGVMLADNEPDVLKVEPIPSTSDSPAPSVSSPGDGLNVGATETLEAATDLLTVRQEMITARYHAAAHAGAGGVDLAIKRAESFAKETDETTFIQPEKKKEKKSFFGKKRV